MTDEVFTASSGVEIKTRDGELVWRGFDAWRSFAPGILQGGGLDVALAEYYQWRRDQELGRWRDPENPSFVAYCRDDLDKVSILDETAGWAWIFRRGAPARSTSVLYEIGQSSQRYFEAHPEPKPWHDAKPGEVWELTYRSPSAREISNRVMTCVDDGGNLSFFNEYRLHTVHYTGIESGRRIWPEVDHE